MNRAAEQLEQQFPEVFQDWHIVREIGRGSYGEVYEIRRESAEIVETAALKHVSYPRDRYDMQRICTELGTADEEAIRENIKETVREYLREYQFMRKFSGQSNIVSCEDYKDIPKKDMPGFDIFIRMEKLTPVSELMLTGKIDREEAIRLGIDICTALELMEEEGVIHRDIKPENLFINDLGNYKLGDFGAARALNKNGETLSMKGTPAYMSPEIFKQEKAGPWTDIYSLGLVLYRIMNRNQPPFMEEGSTSSTVMREKASSRRLSGEKLPPPADADPALSGVILRACAYDRKNRYQTADEFRKALTAISKRKARVKPIKTQEHSMSVDSKMRVTKITEEEKKDLEAQEEARRKAEEEAAREKANQLKTKKTKQHKKVAWITLAVIATIAAAAAAVLFVQQETDRKARFDSAVQLLEDENADSGKYVEAEQIFTELGTYNSAAEKADEARKAARLKEGTDALNAGKLEDAKAILESEELKGFRTTDDLLALTLHKIDVRDQLKEADANIKEAERQLDKEAEENLKAAAEAFGKAEKIYDSLKNDEEAPKASENALWCANYKMYVEAELDLLNKQYSDARFKFSELAEKYHFKDSEARVSQTDEAAALDKANEAFLLGQYQDAVQLYGNEHLQNNAEAIAQKQTAENILAYGKAEILLQNEEYEDAANAFGALESFTFETADTVMDAEKAKKYALGMKALRVDQKYNDAVQLFDDLENYLDAKQKAEEARTAIRLHEGKEALEQGKLADAQKIFEELESSGEAQRLLAETNNQINTNAQLKKAQDQISQAQRQRASALEYREKAPNTYINYLEQAKTSYDNARIIYSGLDGDPDFAEAADSCKHWVDYIQAEIHLAKGQYDDARVGFSELSKNKFEDSDKRLKEVEKAEKLHQADADFAEKKYQSALDLYKQYPEDPQAAARAEEAQKYLSFFKAEELLNSGKYDEAIAAFDKLVPFSNAKKASNYAQGMKAMQEQRYEDAQQLFTLAGGYQDAKAQAENAAALKQLKSSYEEAVTLFNAASYQKARDLFFSVQDFYPDAEGYIEECDRHLVYEQALAEIDKGNFGNAAALLKDLHLDNSDTLAAECEFRDFCANASGMTDPGLILRNCYQYIYTQDLSFDARKTWASQITPGEKTGAAIAEGFANSGQFKNQQIPDKERVSILCDILLAGRDTKGTIKQECMNRLNSGMSMQAALKYIVATNIYSSLCNADGWPVGEVPVTENRDQDYSVTRFVFHCYQQGLNRNPDTGGLNNFCGLLLGGEVTMETVLVGFATSEEAEKKYPADTDFVRMLYRLELGRDASEQEIKNKIVDLQQSKDRSVLAHNISVSPECAYYLDTYNSHAARSEEGKYNQANDLYQKGDFEKAQSIFQSLQDFSDSKTLADRCGMEIFSYKITKGEHVNGIVHRCYDTISRFSALEENEKIKWGKALPKSGSPANILASYISYSAYNSFALSNEDRVTAIYYIMLGHDPDPKSTEYKEFVSSLGCGMSSRYEIYVLSQSPEYQNLVKAEGLNSEVILPKESRDHLYSLTSLVSSGYNIMLNRNASAKELNRWCEAYLNGSINARRIVLAILSSKEAAIVHPNTREFARAAFLFAMGREATQAEEDKWARYNHSQIAEAVAKASGCTKYLTTLGLKR